MNRRLLRYAAVVLPLCLAATALPSAGLAEDAPFFAVNGDDSQLLSFGLGYYDVFDDQDAAEFRAEYRASAEFLIFKPFLGLMATSDAAVYGYGGVLTDFYFGRHFVLTPSIAAGLYHDGDGKDLGHVVEFRSAIEAAYRFDNRSRLGVLFYHISNAGLDDNNAGTEVLGLNYSLPID